MTPARLIAGHLIAVTLMCIGIAADVLLIAIAGIALDLIVGIPATVLAWRATS